MGDYPILARQLEGLLGLTIPALAVAFRDAAPPGVPRVSKSGPASCSYWPLVHAGSVFYTEAEDHFGCAVGAHTHGVTLPPGRAKELDEMIGTMVGLEYVAAEEVAHIPARREPFRVAIYAPLGQTPVDPDVILVRGQARQIMLLAEAAQAAGITAEGSVMGRPACALLPATLGTGRAHTSLGCIGNRVYTGLLDEELYYALPGGKLVDVVGKLEKIVSANRALEKFHLGRRLQTGAPSQES
ncbi:MAG TPA: DUF169 domain-containing protein [Polyangia bacterium]|jgi:uncharacterized protein (DUF169 family)|nr:DUF169 domain-containing protein [Polyangia bacterium]